MFFVQKNVPNSNINYKIPFMAYNINQTVLNLHNSDNKLCLYKKNFTGWFFTVFFSTKYETCNKID